MVIEKEFVKQLPNMPGPHVSRLTLNRKQKSLSMLMKNAKNDYVVMTAGCCSPFMEQKLAENGFLATFQSEHVRGYGTKLMSRTKERTKKLG